jgi:hypothetical protein
MRNRISTLLAGTLGFAVLLAARGKARDDQPPPDPTPQAGVEVQTRGPVHEAFAEPNDTRPQPTVVIPKQPPALIDEVPPDEKPAGNAVVWIPGYWGWDDDQNDFVWVSGSWRIPPPQRHWLPGSWQQVSTGWQWTAGFWGLDSEPEVQYLAAPPPSIDRGPAAPAPDDNSIYAPGCWVFRENKYQWRPGFWVGFRPDWVWIPAHYMWTRGGYVFIAGYWDHPLGQRGLLFAPVRIDRRVVVANWYYTPQFVVQADFLIGALFVRPDRGHYYFGDYFEPQYAKRGYVAWVDFRSSPECYDPNFAYYRHRFNGDRTWETNLRGLYTARTNGTIARPPHTLVQQTTVIRNLTVDKTAHVAINKNINITHLQSVSAVAPVTHFNNTKVTGLASLSTAKVNAHNVENHVVRVEAVPKEQKAAVRTAVTTFRETADKRHVAETKMLAEGHTPIKATDPPRSVKIEVPRAPTVTIKTRTEAIPVKEVPKLPVIPKHEERAIPVHVPPKSPELPRSGKP